MTRGRHRTSLGGLLLSVLLAASARTEPTAPPATDLPRFAALEVGDPAPPLKAARWPRGPEVGRFEPGQIYVLDFWTLWCQPCVALMPHLSELHDRYSSRGVHFVALTAPNEAENSASAIEAHLERKADAIRFAVAYDAPVAPDACADVPLCGVTSLAYLKAAGLDGVPIAFVIDGTGRIAWIGDPAALDPVIEAIASGSWDRTAAAQRYRGWRHAEPRLSEFRSLLNEGRHAEAYAIARALIRGPFASEPGLLRTIAATITSLSLATARDLDLALTAAQNAVDTSGRRDAGAWSVLARTRLARGEFPDAVAAQQRVVDLTEGRLQEIQQRTLDEYRTAAARAVTPLKR